MFCKGTIMTSFFFKNLRDLLYVKTLQWSEGHFLPTKTTQIHTEY